MRILVLAMMLFALGGDAYAQQGGAALDVPGTGSSRRGPVADPNPAPRADEKAYRSALERMPDVDNQKYDPWRNFRQAPQPK